MARARHPALHFREGDAERLPFPSGRLDAVVCNFGIGHFGQPESAAVEFVRVVGSGGHVALSWWDAPTLARMNGIFFDAITEAGAVLPPSVPNGPPPYRFADEAELRALLTIAGLKDVTVRTLADALHPRRGRMVGGGAGQPRARLGRGPVPAPGDPAQDPHGLRAAGRGLSHRGWLRRAERGEYRGRLSALDRTLPLKRFRNIREHSVRWTHADWRAVSGGGGRGGSASGPVSRDGASSPSPATRSARRCAIACSTTWCCSSCCSA